jgi:16S rRNA (uracil1498-N3)-methyltransferase
VVISACEQSGRAVIPDVSAPQPLALGAALREGHGFMLDPQGSASLAMLARQAFDASTLAIGPEGGWSPHDRELLLATGFQGLQLGPRILRTETAGIAAIAALQALRGDLG